VLNPDGSPRPVEEAPPLRALKGETINHQEEMIRTPASGNPLPPGQRRTGQKSERGDHRFGIGMRISAIKGS